VTSAPLAPDSLIGTIVVGRYRIVRVLGEGGMGRVYVAEHMAIQKLVAIKVLRPEFTDRGEIVTRFQQEAISASRIKHPNVLEIFDFGRLDAGPFFLVMELLEGRDLATELRRVRTIDLLTGIRIAFQICAALGAAHSRGVVHRDMKPDNVFLQHADPGVVAVKIVDFGIALLRDDSERAGPDSDRPRLTKAGTILGTPEYMAPEQGAGRRADHRADIYATGIILYEMFTGRVPFSAPTFVETLAKHQTEPPPPMAPALSQELRAVIVRALAKNPDERFQRVHDFERALAVTPEGVMAARQAARTRSFVTSPGSTPPPAGIPMPVTRRTPAPLNPRPRAETPVGTEASVVRAAPGTSKRFALIGLAAAGVMVLAAFAFDTFGRAGSPNASDTPVVTSVGAASPGLEIEVTTNPTGATLRMSGKVVCATTPCRVRATPGERLELEATKGRLRGVLRTPAQNAETLTIPLGESNVRLCNVEVDGVWYGPCEAEKAPSR
jgi:serine/threonine-protein kinase